MADAAEDEDASEDAKLKAAAEAEKKTGADAYKLRDFARAAEHCDKAWETWPRYITFLTNLAACYFEQGEYDKCI